jgi:hypothetical protein
MIYREMIAISSVNREEHTHTHARARTHTHMHTHRHARTHTVWTKFKVFKIKVSYL